MFKFGGARKYQLQVDGKPYAPFRFRLVDAAADAMEHGCATPDKLGRIVLHENADIIIFTNNVATGKASP